MSRRPASSLLLFLSCAGALVAGNDTSPVLKLTNPDAKEAGRALAEKLRSAAPAENAAFHGILKIRPRDGRTEVLAIASRITVGETKWQVTYETTAKESNAAEKLTIIHAPGRPNEYLYSSGTNTSDRPIPLADDLAARPFAGSDFWLMDLGLEFFHWPEQRLRKPEMRHNRSCRVLESINPASDPAGYARVVSWIDLETDGLVCAEAYDRGNRLVKEFSVGSFRKVEGRYELQDMKIRNPKAGRRTELEFDLKK
jgi:hypothetical protein